MIIVVWNDINSMSKDYHEIEGFYLQGNLYADVAISDLTDQLRPCSGINACAPEFQSRGQIPEGFGRERSRLERFIIEPFPGTPFAAAKMQSNAKAGHVYSHSQKMGTPLT
jgi:hypothetical protein